MTDHQAAEREAMRRVLDCGWPSRAEALGVYRTSVLASVVATIEGEIRQEYPNGEFMGPHDTRNGFLCAGCGEGPGRVSCVCDACNAALARAIAKVRAL